MEPDADGEGAGESWNLQRDGGALCGRGRLRSGVAAGAGSRSQTRPVPEANTRRLDGGKDFTWPMAPAVDGKSVDLRAAPFDPHYVDHSTTLLDPSRKLAWVTALHPGKRLIFGYLFKREE